MAKMTKAQAKNRLKEARLKIMNVYISDFGHAFTSKANHRKLRDMGEQLADIIKSMM